MFSQITSSLTVAAAATLIVLVSGQFHQQSRDEATNKAIFSSVKNVNTDKDSSDDQVIASLLLLLF